MYPYNRNSYTSKTSCLYRTCTLVPYLKVMSLQLIWNLLVLDQIYCRDMTTWQGTRIITPAMAAKLICPFRCPAIQPCKIPRPFPDISQVWNFPAQWASYRFLEQAPGLLINKHHKVQSTVIASSIFSLTLDWHRIPHPHERKIWRVFCCVQSLSKGWGVCYTYSAYNTVLWQGSFCVCAQPMRGDVTL